MPADQGWDGGPVWGRSGGDEALPDGHVVHYHADFVAVRPNRSSRGRVTLRCTAAKTRTIILTICPGVEAVLN